MDIASFISLLPPENVVLPPLDVKLVQVFGSLCVWKPEMLQRYPELGRAALLFYRSRTSDDLERDAIQSLLDSGKPTSGKSFITLPSILDYTVSRRPVTLSISLTYTHLTSLKGDDEASLTVFITEQGSIVLTAPLVRLVCGHIFSVVLHYSQYHDTQVRSMVRYPDPNRWK